jgi:hypothetical protein
MFSLDTGSEQRHCSTNDQEPIYLDADAEDIGLLFDMLTFPPDGPWQSRDQQIPVERCVALMSLSFTFSFWRVNTIVERILDQHLAIDPFHVLAIASSLQDLVLGRRALHYISKRSQTCGRYPCDCGPFWRDFNGMSRAWRSELAFCVVQCACQPVPRDRISGMGLPMIDCTVLGEAADTFNPG